MGLRLLLPETRLATKLGSSAPPAPAEYRLAQAKSEIALAELDRLIAAGVRFGKVLADAWYGENETAHRRIACGFADGEVVRAFEKCGGELGAFAGCRRRLDHLPFG